MNKTSRIKSLVWLSLIAMFCMVITACTGDGGDASDENNNPVITDTDGDGYTTTDCAPNDATLWQEMVFYPDADNDNLPENGATLTECVGNASTYPANMTPNAGPPWDPCPGDPTNQCGSTVDYDGDGYPVSTDCNDNDATVWTNLDFYPDGDNDTLPDSYTATTYCVGNTPTYPAGRTLNAPPPLDPCLNDPTNTCGSVTDADGDGFPNTVDCNDNDASIYPGATEILCDFVDQNCNGFADDDQNLDGDYVTFCNGDCNDLIATIYPGAPEITCDGIDQNCNGTADDDPNADGDPVSVCGGDCNDNDATIYPGATEIMCDLIDQNCNGMADNDANVDGDPVTVCGGDCDDNVASVYPGAAETLCDNIDQNCNGLTDDDVNADGDPVSFCNGDCNDSVATIYPGATEIMCDLVDQDCDGLADDDTNVDGDPVSFCDGDCDDSNPAIYPGAAEILCDGIDQNCNGPLDEDINADGDLVSVCAGDCDDTDPTIHPGATEIMCDSIDQNCNGLIDDDTNVDGDPVSFCAGDCNDNVDTIYPGAPEILCDSIDQNCNGLADDDINADGDPISVCGGDCNDGDNTIYPGATEILCDLIDQDCDGLSDDDVNADGDPVSFCDGDCNDNVSSIYPGAPETLCDGIDQNCNSPAIDDDDYDFDGDGVSFCSGDCNQYNANFWQNMNFWSDFDIDTLPDDNTIYTWCVGDPPTYPLGYTTNAPPPLDPCPGDPLNLCNTDADGDGWFADVDCNDGNSSIYPGAPEVMCDLIDQDCDGLLDDDANADGDPVTVCGGDCNDADASIYLGAPEIICDGIDQNCNGLADDDINNDGDPVSVCGGDCNDSDASIYPGATEVLCDLIDQDCDGLLDDDVNADGDPISQCNGDCNDSDPTIHPWATEILCDGIDQNCNGLADDDTNTDSDPFSLCSGDCNDADASIYPGAPETLCDGIDQNCNGLADDDLNNDGDAVTVCGGDCNDYDANAWQLVNFWFDGDLDDVPDVATGPTWCVGDTITFPVGYTTTAPPPLDPCLGDPLNLCAIDADGDGYFSDVDCNDGNSSIYPGAPEVMCDGIDQNCNGLVDDDANADGDLVTLCNGDCDDADASIYPGAPETLCDGIDQNCNGLVDDDANADGDPVTYCSGDCNDADATVYPGAPETLCDLIDQNCNGIADDDQNLDGDAVTHCNGDCNDIDANAWQLVDFYADFDIDTLPDTASVNTWCVGNPATYPIGYTTNAPPPLDPCPGDPLNLCNTDADGDGFMADVDCNDANASIYPGAPETMCDGIDQDCDGLGDDDANVDGDIATVCSGDCNDNDATIYPGAPEIACDLIDQNCNGLADDDPNADGDPVTYCNGDCDDADPTVYPGAAEVICDGIDQNCNGLADDDFDNDGDLVSHCNGDCNDYDPNAWQLVDFYLDADIDALPDDTVANTLCMGNTTTFPVGYTTNPPPPVDPCLGDPLNLCATDADGDGFFSDVDCDDGNSAIYPGALEIQCDGIDQNCNGIADDDPNLDGDPVSVCGGDCNDADATIYPGATEILCDFIDQNCNGLADDDANADGDAVTVCGGDCNDADATIYPGAPETMCDGIDQDCDGLADDDVNADGDPVTVCGGDCNDSDASIYPGATEIMCDLIDQDCDGLADDDANADGDPVTVCGGDCNDADASIYPGAPETLCDGVDQDCDGLADDDVNADGDLVSFCSGDCNDADPNAYQYVDMWLDGDVDTLPDNTVQNTWCLGGPSTFPVGYTTTPPPPVDPCLGDPLNLCATDADGDGFMATVDCDDGDSTIYPGAPEVTCDGIDQNCNGLADDDPDGDGDGVGVCTDCNDADNTIYPGATEITCDGIDQDCDGLADDNPDGDGDGVGICTDCNDADNTIYPGATEITCDGIDQDCDGLADDSPDGDGDGVGICTDCNDANINAWQFMNFWLDADVDTLPDDTVSNTMCVGDTTTYPVGYTNTPPPPVDPCLGDPLNLCATDADGDGYMSTVDCNDGDSSVWVNQDFYPDADNDDLPETGIATSYCVGDTTTYPIGMTIYPPPPLDPCPGDPLNVCGGGAYVSTYISLANTTPSSLQVWSNCEDAAGNFVQVATTGADDITVTSLLSAGAIAGNSCDISITFSPGIVNSCAAAMTTVDHLPCISGSGDLYSGLYGDGLAEFTPLVSLTGNTVDEILASWTVVNDATNGIVFHVVFQSQTTVDSDSDGIADANDNCPWDANVGQANSDTDSHGDACDNCPYTDNEDQLDTDLDGIGDVCEPPFVPSWQITGVLSSTHQTIEIWGDCDYTHDDLNNWRLMGSATNTNTINISGEVLADLFSGVNPGDTTITCRLNIYVDTPLITGPCGTQGWLPCQTSSGTLIDGLGGNGLVSLDFAYSPIGDWSDTIYLEWIADYNVPLPTLGGAHYLLYLKRGNTQPDFSGAWVNVMKTSDLDIDGDWVNNPTDTCIWLSNPAQGINDCLGIDDDNDGWRNAVDPNPSDPTVY